MVYHNQNYWVFGLSPLSGILRNRKHDVLEKTPTQLSPLDRANFNHWTTHLRTETDPVSETLCFLFPRVPDDGESPKTK
jgi:hypothetical protein